jgi:hypothetical protein
VALAIQHTARTGEQPGLLTIEEGGKPVLALSSRRSASGV